MLLRIFLFILGFAFTAQCGFAATPAHRLSKKEIAKAERVKSLSIPSSGALLAALNKLDQPNWKTEYVPPIPVSYDSREQAAFDLGTLITDAYLALEARDTQQVKNCGRDIVSLAKTLGVSETLMRRDNSLNGFADANAWSTLHEELDAIHNEIALALVHQSDSDLTTLLRVGAWMRSMDAVSGWTAAHYSVANARLLQIPALAADLQKEVLAVSPRTQKDRSVQLLVKQLPFIVKLCSNSPAPLDPPQVKSLHNTLHNLLHDFTKPKP